MNLRLPVAVLVTLLSLTGCTADDSSTGAGSSALPTPPTVPARPPPTERAPDDLVAYVDSVVDAARTSLRTGELVAPVDQDCDVCRWVRREVMSAAADGVRLRGVSLMVMDGPLVESLADGPDGAERRRVVALGSRALIRRVDDRGRRVGLVQGDVPVWGFEVESTDGGWRLLDWTVLAGDDGPAPP